MNELSDDEWEKVSDRYGLAMLLLTAKRNGMLEENCSPKETTVIGYRLFKYTAAIVMKIPINLEEKFYLQAKVKRS